MKILFKMKLQTDLNTEMDVNLILVSLFQFVEFSVIGGNIQGKFQVIRSWWIVWIQMLCKADSLKPQCNGLADHILSGSAGICGKFRMHVAVPQNSGRVGKYFHNNLLMNYKPSKVF